MMALVGYILLEPWMSFQISSYGVLGIVAFCYGVDSNLHIYGVHNQWNCFLYISYCRWVLIAFGIHVLQMS